MKFALGHFVLLTIFVNAFFGCSTPTVSSSDDDEDYSSSEIRFSSSRAFSSSSEDVSSSAEAASSSSLTQSSSSQFSSGNSEKKLTIYEAVKESGVYTSRDSVGAYICKFDKLPKNYVGKNEGQKLYESSTGNTFSKWNFNPWKTLGVMIGGDSFGNKEKLLPDGTYREADVDYGNVQSRGTKRLVYQTGCIIYYTADHYESYKLLEFR